MSESTFVHEVHAIIRRRLDGNRWLTYSLERLTRRGAAIYVQQHGIFTRHSRRCWAYVVGQCPEVDVRRFIVRENLFEEEGSEETSHFTTLVRMGEALGLTSRDVHEARALPGTRAALLMWEALTKDRHWLIGAAAKATLEQMNMPEAGEQSGVQGRAWMEQLGLSRADVDFWLMHDEVDRIHGSGAFSLIEQHAAKHPYITRDELLTAVDDSAFAWNIFWNAIGEAAEAQEPVAA